MLPYGSMRRPDGHPQCDGLECGESFGRATVDYRSSAHL
jgi:hypothetical protein